MTSEKQVYSILAVDIGSSRTKASLFELVEGRHRFVAGAEVRTTLFSPIDDVSVGVRQAIEKIEKIRGRAILSSTGPIVPEKRDGSGVDFFVTTTSVGRGLRLLILASSADVAFVNRFKRLAELGAIETELLLIDSSNGGADARLSDLSKAIVRFGPHAIYIIGEGSEASQLSALGQDIVEALSSLGQEDIPVRLLGEPASASALATRLRGYIDFRHVGSQSISKKDDLLALQRDWTGLWEQRVVREIPGYASIVSWQSAPVEHSFFALGNTMRFLSRFYNNEVLAVDFGSSSIGLFWITSEENRARLSYRYGVGSGAIGLLDCGLNKEPPSNQSSSIKRWLPFKLPDDEVGNLILNKWARPWTVPETVEEILFERALGVESVRRVRAEVADAAYVFRNQKNLALVVGSGGVLANQNSVARMALTLLDALEPAGVFRLAIDRDAVSSQLGAIGRVFPQEAAEVILSDAMLELGTCLACSSGGRPGSKAVVVELTQEENHQRIEVPFGDIRAVPLAAGKTAEVTVKPARGVDFGWGKGKAGKLTVRGGALGLIIDARGRPIQVDLDKHSETVGRWLESLGAEEAK